MGCPHRDAVGELIFHNRYSYANGNPVNLTDPSGHCVGCEADFRVRLADADLPDLRDEVLESFKNRYFSFSGDIWDVLGREIDFVRWMQNSGRLSTGNWYDISDAYLAASRFAGERLANYIKSGNQCGDIYLGQLEPGVAEWAAFILAADPNIAAVTLELQHFLIADEAFIAGGSTVLNIGFWRAHNAALREGVRRADAAGLRASESAEERALMNFILYDVLEPGDQCAAGNIAFCAFTFPLFLNIGTGIIMPQSYPATQQDLDQMVAGFGNIYVIWNILGARPPDPQIHLIR